MTFYGLPFRNCLAVDAKPVRELLLRESHALSHVGNVAGISYFNPAELFIHQLLRPISESCCRSSRSHHTASLAITPRKNAVVIASLIPSSRNPSSFSVS